MKVFLALALCAAAAVAAISSARGGEPDRGGLVWTSNGCGACHVLGRAGSSGKAGPNLDRWLVPNAQRLELTPGMLTYRRVYWGGRGMPAYGTTLGRQELDDLVSFVTGVPFDAPPGAPTPLAPLPPPPPLVTVPAKTVAGWVMRKRLGPTAARGAALFAKVGCLSCHTYLGSGKRRRGGPDLTTVGRSGWKPGQFAAYAARPYRHGNDLMPMYADLGADALTRLGAFLSASR